MSGSTDQLEYNIYIYMNYIGLYNISVSYISHKKPYYIILVGGFKHEFYFP